MKKRLALLCLLLPGALLIGACALTGSVGISLSNPTVTPTPNPQLTFDYSANLTQGILFGAVILAIVIIGGTMSVISSNQRKK